MNFDVKTALARLGIVFITLGVATYSESAGVGGTFLATLSWTLGVATVYIISEVDVFTYGGAPQ